MGILNGRRNRNAARGAMARKKDDVYLGLVGDTPRAEDDDAQAITPGLKKTPSGLFWPSIPSIKKDEEKKREEDEEEEYDEKELDDLFASYLRAYLGTQSQVDKNRGRPLKSIAEEVVGTLEGNEERAQDRRLLKEVLFDVGAYATSCEWVDDEHILTESWDGVSRLWNPSMQVMVREDRTKERDNRDFDFVHAFVEGVQRKVRMAQMRLFAMDAPVSNKRRRLAKSQQIWKDGGYWRPSKALLGAMAMSTTMMMPTMGVPAAAVVVDEGELSQWKRGRLEKYRAIQQDKAQVQGWAVRLAQLENEPFGQLFRFNERDSEIVEMRTGIVDGIVAEIRDGKVNQLQMRRVATNILMRQEQAYDFIRYWANVENNDYKFLMGKLFAALLEEEEEEQEAPKTTWVAGEQKYARRNPKMQLEDGTEQEDRDLYVMTIKCVPQKKGIHNLFTMQEYYIATFPDGAALTTPQAVRGSADRNDEDDEAGMDFRPGLGMSGEMMPPEGGVVMLGPKASSGAAEKQKKDDQATYKRNKAIVNGSRRAHEVWEILQKDQYKDLRVEWTITWLQLVLGYSEDAFTTFMYEETKVKGKEVLEFIAQSCVMVVEKMFGKNASDDFDYDKKKWFVHNVLMAKMKGRGKEKKEKKKEGDKEGKSKKDKKKDGGDKYPWDFLRKAYKAYKSLVKSSVSDVELPIKEYANLLEEDRIKWVNGIMGDKAALQKNFGKTERARFVLAEIEGVLGTKIVRVARNDEERSKALQSLKNEDEAVRREKVRLARIVVESKSGNIASDEMMIAIERYVDYVGDNQGGAVRERWMQEKRESQVEEARERLERDRQERAEAQRRREQEEAEVKRKRERKRLKGMNTVDVGQGERKRKDDALDEFQNRREIIYEQTKDSESPPQGGPLLFTKLTFYVHNPDQVKSLAVAPGKLGYGLDAADIFALEPRKPAVSRAAAAAAAARAAAAGATDSDEEEEEEEEDEDVEMEAHPLQSTQQKPPLLLGAPADGEDEQAGSSSPPGAAAASSSSSTGEGGRQRASGGSGGSRPAAAGLRVRRLPPEAGINRYGFNALSVFGVATGEPVNGAAFSESFQYEASERMMVTVSDPEDHAKVMMLPLASDGSQLPVAMRSFRLDDAYGLHNWRPRQQDGGVKGQRPGMNYSMLLSGRMQPNLQKMENRYQPVAFSRNAEESVCVLFVDKEIAEAFAEAETNCYDLREINTNLMAGAMPFVLLVYDRYGRLSALMHNETEGSYIDAARLRLARVNVIPEAIGSKLREGEDWKGPDGESKPNIFVDKFGVQLDYLKLTLRDGTRLYAGLEEGDGWGDAVGRYQYKRLQDMGIRSELLVLKMYTQVPEYREGDAAPADGAGKDDERDEDEDPDEESWEKREEKKARMERRKAERMQREIGDGTEWSTVSKDQYDRRMPVFTRYVESAQVVVEAIPENNTYFVRAIRFLNRETDDAASIINYDLTFDRVRPLRRERLPDNTYRQSYAYNPWHDEEFRVMYEQMDRLILDTVRDAEKQAEYQKMVELETLKSKENKKKKEEEEKKAQAEAEQQKKDSVDILSSARSTWGEAAKQTLAERQAKHAAEQARRAAQERARLAAEEKARRDAEFEAEQEAAKLLEEQRKAAKKMPAMPAAAGKEKKRRSKKSKKKGQDDENDAEDQQEGQPDDQQPGQEQQQQQQDVPEGEDQGEGAGGPEQGEDDQTNNVDDDQGHADEEYYDADVMQAEAEAMLGGGEETSRYDYISEVMKMRDTRLGKLDLHGIGGRRIPWFMRLTRTHPRTKIIFPEYKDYNRYGLYEVFVKQVWGEMKEAAAGGGQTQQGGSAREEAEDEEVRQFREERAKEAINGMQTCTFFFTSALGYGVRDITVTKEPESGGMCKVELLLETFNLTHIETGKEQLTEEERAQAMTEVMQRLPKPTARDREILQENRRERERLLAEERSRKNQEYMRRKAEAEAEERRKEKEQRKKEKEERKKQEQEERKQRLKEDGVEIEEAKESSSSSSSSSSDDEDEQPAPRAAAATNEDKKKSGSGGGTGGSDGFLPSGPSGGGGSSRPPASSTPSRNSGGNGPGTAPTKPKKGNRNNDRGYEGFGGGGGGGGVSFRSGGGGGGGRGWHGGTVNRNNGVRQMFGINAKGVYRHDARQNAHFAYFKSGKDQTGPARRWMYQNGVLHKQKKGASGVWEDHFSSDSYNREATAGWDDEEYDDQFDEDLDDWWEGQQNGYSDDDRSSRYSDRDYDSGRDDYDPREDDYDSGRDDYDSRDDEHDPRDDGYDDPRDPRNWDQYGDDDDDRYDQDDDPYRGLYGDDDDNGGRGGKGKGKGRDWDMDARADDAMVPLGAPASYSARPIVKTAEKGTESRAVRQLQKSPLAKAIPGKLRRTVVRVRWDGVVELMRIRSKKGGVLPKEDRIGPVQVFSGGKHEGAGTCVCVIPHLKVVATGGVDGTVRIWDPKTMHAAKGIEVIRQHGAVPVRCIAASPDGQLLASGDQQGVLVICRLTTPELNKTCTRLSLQRGDILCASWSPEGRFLAVGTRDASITVFEWRNNKMQQCAVLVAHTAHVHALEWAPNGKYLASVGADGTLRIWDFRRSTFGGVLATELTRGCPILAHFDQVRTIVAFCSAFHCRLLIIFLDQIWAVRWSPNGTRIATCGKDGYLAVWYATKLIRFAIRNRC